MEVTQAVTVAYVRVVVTSTHNDLYTARLTETQLEEISERYGLVFKRPRGKSVIREIEQIEEKERENAS